MPVPQDEFPERQSIPEHYGPDVEYKGNFFFPTSLFTLEPAQIVKIYLYGQPGYFLAGVLCVCAL